MMNYEAAVHWMRARPEQAQNVLDSYLDADNEVAARRFADSEEFATVASWLGLRGARKTILDVGCGNGIASYAMGTLGHNVTALDPDASADVGLEAARRLVPLVEKAGGKMRCELGYVEALPFANASFDVVYTRQAVHHFADLEAGLGQCCRVLKPGGLFLATREHVVSDDAQLRQFLENHALHHLHGGENAHPLERYQAALGKAGFDQIQSIGFWESVVNHFPTSNRRVEEILVASWNKRLRVPLGEGLMKIGRINALSRQMLSRRHNEAGRLYSFLCRKSARDQRD